MKTRRFLSHYGVCAPDVDLSHTTKRQGNLVKQARRIKVGIESAMNSGRKVRAFVLWTKIKEGKILLPQSLLIRRDHAKEFALFDQQEALLKTKQACPAPA